ncbi:MAG: hypothetical protein RSF79_29125, partial [Janthinobacterium sp.]
MMKNTRRAGFSAAECRFSDFSASSTCSAALLQRCFKTQPTFLLAWCCGVAWCYWRALRRLPGIAPVLKL